MGGETLGALKPVGFFSAALVQDGWQHDGCTNSRSIQWGDRFDTGGDAWLHSGRPHSLGGNLV